MSKEKKSGSRSLLRVELFDARKIVGRLSEEIGEKDLRMQQLREINKEVNRRN